MFRNFDSAKMSASMQVFPQGAERVGGGRGVPGRGGPARGERRGEQRLQRRRLRARGRGPHARPGTAIFGLRYSKTSSRQKMSNDDKTRYTLQVQCLDSLFTTRAGRRSARASSKLLFEKIEWSAKNDHEWSAKNDHRWGIFYPFKNDQRRRSMILQNVAIFFCNF